MKLGGEKEKMPFRLHQAHETHAFRVFVRRIVPVAIGFPLFFIFLITAAQFFFPERIHLTLSPSFGTLIIIAIGAVCFAAPIFWAAALFYRHENEALRGSEKRYRQLFEDSPQPMWIFDLETLGFLDMNDAAIARYGYSREEFLAMNLREIRPPEDISVLDENLAKAAQGLELSGGIRHKKKDGSLMEVEIASHETIFDGRRARLVLVNDVTDKNKIKSQLLRTQRMESIGTLASGIAHDLNNVLSPILMAAQLLKDKLRDDSHLRLVETLETSARRGAAIVRQVLTFARGTEGERVALQLTHLLGGIQKMLAQTFPKSIRIEMEIPKNLWMVRGDATQIDQILLNLCVNARDAMADAGRLRIAAENIILDEHYARLNLEAKAGPYVVLDVSDTGPGIRPDVVEKIFEPFFTTKEIGKGTGLGLSTVQAIVKSHGGFVNVYSEIGKGARFKVYIPAIESAATQEGIAQAENLPRGQGEMILVVDDEASVRDITKLTLESYDYKVITAGDGADATAQFARRSSEIKAVLLDMMMPIMDGAATIQVLEKMNPNVKIIAASGLVDNARYTSANASIGGVVKAVLAKPYTAGQLLKTIHEVLGRDTAVDPAPIHSEGIRHILVVDDDDSVRTLICSCLESSGYKALAASNGTDAQRILKQVKCDLVITDIRMPHGDGIELSNILRRDRPELKIIMMSGDALPLRYLDSSEEPLGVITLSKPLEVATLLSTVKTALNSGSRASMKSPVEDKK